MKDPNISHFPPLFFAEQQINYVAAVTEDANIATDVHQYR
jgi:hypothetical protein